MRFVQPVINVKSYNRGEPTVYGTNETTKGLVTVVWCRTSFSP